MLLVMSTQHRRSTNIYFIWGGIMINKKAVAIGAAVVVLFCAIAAISLGKHKQNTSAKPLSEGGAQGLALIDGLEAVPDLSAALESENAYVPVEVKKAFIDGGSCAKVIVHNNTLTPVTAYTLNIIYFDKNGKALEETKEFTVDGVMALGESDFGLDSYVGGSNNASYIKAVITSVTYNDGTGWVNDNALLEVATQKTAFDIEAYNQAIKKNEENVKKAASTPYLYIDKMTITSADEISARKELKLVLTNTGDKTIRDIKVAVAEFDKDNKPVDVSPQIYIGKNIRLASCKGMELFGKSSRSFSAAAFLGKDCFRINAIVTEITFADGTVWQNPYAIDWLLWFM